MIADHHICPHMATKDPHRAQASPMTIPRGSQGGPKAVPRDPKSVPRGSSFPSEPKRVPRGPKGAQKAPRGNHQNPTPKTIKSHRTVAHFEEKWAKTTVLSHFSWFSPLSRCRFSYIYIYIYALKTAILEHSRGSRGSSPKRRRSPSLGASLTAPGVRMTGVPNSLK